MNPSPLPILFAAAALLLVSGCASTVPPTLPAEPDGATAHPSESAKVRPDSAMVRPDPATVRPDSAVVRPDSAMVRRDSAMVPPDPAESLVPLQAVPAARREFRGAWIATVANIDWPSEPGLSTRAQQDELRALLDQAVSLRLNAIVFQVRSVADAMYASELEPWSYYLTGTPGHAPDPPFDPLAFAVEEAHRRGLELHAWFNPFRAGHPTQEQPHDSLHVSLRSPSWVKAYGEYVWLDPGVPQAREHSLAVLLDVLRRYDVDGVHMDDYFYPYAVRDSLGNEVAFPDSASFAASGWQGSRADWRRRNVDLFVEALYDSVKAVKPFVKVGISPFGIWRPGYPAGVEGFDAFEGLYADARKWLRRGWLDYVAPQLYWRIDSGGQPYEPLLRWWIDQNRSHRHIWPGNYASRVILEGAARWEPGEIGRQVALTREIPGAGGNVHFSMKALRQGPGADRILADSVYGEPALIPASPWLSKVFPGRPQVQGRPLGNRHLLDLTPGEGPEPFVWHVREFDGRAWRIRVVPAWKRQLRWDVPPRLVVVSAVDRTGQEGPAAIERLRPEGGR